NIQTAQWEKLIRIEIQPDLEKVDEYPNILNKDISNGNLEASELHFYNSNKELHFSSEAFVQKIKVIEDTHIDEPLESYSYITFEDIFVYYGNKQARPVKFFSIGNYIYPSQEKISELRDFHEDIFRDPYLNLVTELWLNPSGKISRLHFVSTKSYYTESGLTAEYYEYKERDSFLAPIVKCNNCSSVCPFTNSWSSPSVFDPNIYEICEWHNEIGFDKIDKYVQEWIETGEIPDELESIPLIGTWVSW
ncbi:hypothetical protein KKA08_06055, partial [bacterium]|nr:hypothetical protein [bacterium]